MFCKFSIKRDECDEELIYFASVDIYVVKYRLEYRSIEDLEAASWPDGLSPPFPHSYAPTRKFPPKTNSFLRRDGLKGLPVARVHFSIGYWRGWNASNGRYPIARVDMPLHFSIKSPADAFYRLLRVRLLPPRKIMGLICTFSLI